MRRPLPLRSWASMRRDHNLLNQWMEVGDDEYPETRRERVGMWLTCYAPGHRVWMRASLWWHYHVLRYPKPPPLDRDPVFRQLFGSPDEVMGDGG